MRLSIVACFLFALSCSGIVAEDTGVVITPDPESPEHHAFEKKLKVKKRVKKGKRKKTVSIEDSLDPDRIDVLTDLKEKIKVARKNIWPYAKFDDEASFDLVGLKEAFDDLEIYESSWESICKAEAIHRWPGQTYRQAYGAHIFFPHEDINLMDQLGDTSLIYRPDIKFSLMIAAAYNYPVAQLKVSGYFHHCAFVPEDFCERVYKDAEEQVKKVVKRKNDPLYPEAVYLLANTKYSQREKLKLLKKSTLLKAKLQALNIRRDLKVIKDKPSIEDYIELGEQGLNQAYYEAAMMVEDDVNEFEYLEKAYDAGGDNSYIPALEMLVSLNRKNENYREVKKWQKHYYKSNFSEGYLLNAYSLIGQKFGGLTELKLDEVVGDEGIEIEDLLQAAAKKLIRATKLKNPRAAHCLGIIYEKLNEQSFDSDETNYKKLATEAFLEATRLGNNLSVKHINQGFPHATEYVDTLMRVYGDNGYD